MKRPEEFPQEYLVKILFTEEEQSKEWLLISFKHHNKDRLNSKREGYFNRLKKASNE